MSGASVSGASVSGASVGCASVSAFAASVFAASVFAASVFAALWPCASARAQDGGLERCDEPPVRRPQATFPSNNAQSVSLDAPLRVRYSEGYFGPEGPGGDPASMLSVLRCAGACTAADPCEAGADPVSGLVQILNDELVFVPDGEWQPSTAYSGLARGRDGDLAFRFCAGSARDDDPPTLGRIGEVTSTVAEPRCGAPEGGYRIGVFFAPASDTGPPGSIEYLLFQTRGPGIDGPVLRDRVRNFSATDQIPMAFVLPREEATGTICVRVAAVDGVGNFVLSAQDGDRPECVDPVQGNFFYPLCSASAPGASSAGRSGLALGLAAFGLVALLLVLARRR